LIIAYDVRASLCQRLFSLRLPCKVAGLYATGVAAEGIISQTNSFSPEIIIRFQPVNSNSKAKATKVQTKFLALQKFLCAFAPWREKFLRKATSPQVSV
jgi:hypothetical protein